MDRQEKQKLDEHIEGVYADTEDTNYLEMAKNYLEHEQAKAKNDESRYLQFAQVAVAIAMTQAAERDAAALEALVAQGKIKPARWGDVTDETIGIAEEHANAYKEGRVLWSSDDNAEGAPGSYKEAYYLMGRALSNIEKMTCDKHGLALKVWSTAREVLLITEWGKEVKSTFKDSPYTFHVSTEQDSQDGTWHFVVWDEDPPSVPYGQGDTPHAAIADLCNKIAKEEESDED